MASLIIASVPARHSEPWTQTLQGTVAIGSKFTFTQCCVIRPGNSSYSWSVFIASFFVKFSARWLPATNPTPHTHTHVSTNLWPGSLKRDTNIADNTFNESLVYRHQTPSNRKITSNRFSGDQKVKGHSTPTIFL